MRIILATNKNLEEEMIKGRFRDDLYYRINVFPIWIPPLRERKQDIYTLLENILPKICKRVDCEEKTISSEAVELLLSYSWPGNVRELVELNMLDPLLQDIKVRQALIHAISRDNLGTYMSDFESPAYSLILSKCLNYSEEAVDYYKENYGYDPEFSKKLLAEAGWTEPFLLVDNFCGRNVEATNPDPDNYYAMVAEARKTVDYDKRTELITELQKKLFDYSTIVPLVDLNNYRCWRSEIQGIVHTPNGGFYLGDVVADANGNFRNVK